MMGKQIQLYADYKNTFIKKTNLRINFLRVSILLISIHHYLSPKKGEYILRH